MFVNNKEAKMDGVWFLVIIGGGSLLAIGSTVFYLRDILFRSSSPEDQASRITTDINSEHG